MQRLVLRLAAAVLSAVVGFGGVLFVPASPAAAQTDGAARDVNGTRKVMLVSSRRTTRWFRTARTDSRKTGCLPTVRCADLGIR